MGNLTTGRFLLRHAQHFAGVPVAGFVTALHMIEYHLALLDEAGLITIHAKLSGAVWQIGQITWAGHDFLDTIRDPAIWRETKAGAKQAGGFSLDLLKALAKGLIKKKIEQHTGVELDL